MRSSLPSRFCAEAGTPAAAIACDALCSCGTVSASPPKNRTIMTAKIAHPWRTLPTHLPNV